MSGATGAMNADIRPIRTAAETALGDLFASVRDALPGGRAVSAAREQGFAPIAARGLPSRRVEEWKYTDLRALMRVAQPLSGPPSAADIAAARALLPFAEVEAARAVFVNGAYVAELSDPLDGLEGVSVRRLPDALEAGGGAVLAPFGLPEGEPAAGLNAAFVGDGLVIEVAAGARPDKALHVANVQVGVGHAAYGRVAATLGAGAAFTLIESHVGDAGAHQTNGLVSLDLADAAELTLVKLQDEGLATLHLATLTARLGARTKLSSLALSAGSAAARQQLFVSFEGDHASAELTGAGFAGAKRHLDTTLVVTHDALHCASREHFKTALDGQARSVFQGKIVVKPGAQKTDGKMMAQALLLSEDAEADAKPELEIFADDVVCGHGATVGALDDELLFYLKARGIPQGEAEALLVRAFVGEVLEGVEDEPLRDALLDRAARWLVARD